MGLHLDHSASVETFGTGRERLAEYRAGHPEIQQTMQRQLARGEQEAPPEPRTQFLGDFKCGRSAP